MVKRGKSSAKSVKTEEAAVEEQETPVDNATEDTTNVDENGDGDSKKKVKGKSSKKEDLNEGNSDETKENGHETVDKKKPAAKKAKAASKKPAGEPERKSNRQPKPIVKQGDENETFEVEQILDSRLHYGRVEYLVRWKGYSRGDDSWEEEADLNNCTELLQKFKAEKDKGNNKRKSTSKSPARSGAKKARPAKETNYEVEAVVGMRVKGGKKEYKIHWKGYKSSEDTWEPEKHLSCEDLIEKYLAENQDKVQEEEVKEKTPLKRKAPATKSKSAKKGKKAK